MQVEQTASLTLPEEEPSVYDYVTTIRGRLYTYGDAGEELRIGRIRAWKIQLESIEAHGHPPENTKRTWKATR